MCIPDCKSNRDCRSEVTQWQQAGVYEQHQVYEILHTRVLSIPPRKCVGINLLGKLLRQGVDGDARWRDARKGKEIAARDPFEWACNRIAECDVEVEPGKDATGQTRLNLATETAAGRAR